MIFKIFEASLRKTTMQIFINSGTKILKRSLSLRFPISRTTRQFLVLRSYSYSKLSLSKGIVFGVSTVTGTSLLCLLSNRCSILPATCHATNDIIQENDALEREEKHTNKDSGDVPFDWKLLWELVKPEKWCLLASIVSALVVAFLNIKIPITLGDLVNVISKYLEHSEETRSFLKDIKQPVLKLLQLYVAQSFFTFLYISGLSYSGERMANRLRCSLFTSIIKQDVAFFDSHKIGEIVSRLTSDVQEFKSAFKMCVSQGLRSVTQAAGCVVSLYFISSKLTGVIVLVLPALIIAGVTVGSILRVLSKAAQAQTAKTAGIADEALGNIRTVKAFAMESEEIEIYQRECSKSEKLQINLGIAIGAFQGVINFALNGLVLGVLGFGGVLFCSQEMSAGSLMSFLVASQTIQRSLTQLSLLFGVYVRGTSAGSRVFQYIKLVPSISLNEGQVIEKNSLNGDIEFKNVSFAYPTRLEQMVLNNFNLIVPRGKIVALCGLSGGGKSTVASLLERFYDVGEGEITLDGHDIRKLNPTWLRGEVIGFINQEPVLFASSVLENIRYGRPNASDEEVYEAAKMANAYDFVSDFPDGFNTVLGERGVTVSGGQKQRIAIARALLKSPKVLVLDEATSALDAESEKVVQEALDKVVKGRTVLIIAHRLSTIQNADIIAVIANGRVAEMGNHSNLLKLKGLYWQLTQQQIIYEEK